MSKQGQVIEDIGNIKNGQSSDKPINPSKGIARKIRIFDSQDNASDENLFFLEAEKNELFNYFKASSYKGGEIDVNDPKSIAFKNCKSHKDLKFCWVSVNIFDKVYKHIYNRYRFGWEVVESQLLNKRFERFNNIFNERTLDIPEGSCNVITRKFKNTGSGGDQHFQYIIMARPSFELDYDYSGTAKLSDSLNSIDSSGKLNLLKNETKFVNKNEKDKYNVDMSIDRLLRESNPNISIDHETNGVLYNDTANYRIASIRDKMFPQK